MTEMANTTCEFEIQRSHGVNGYDQLSLSCKTHGVLSEYCVTHYTTDCQILSQFQKLKKAHLEAVAPKPKVELVEQPKLSSCEQLMVERVDAKTDLHYLILLCKLHGQLCEEVIYPASSWYQQGRLQLLWKQHVAEYKDRPKTAPKKLQPSPEPTVSPYSFKRKFS